MWKKLKSRGAETVEYAIVLACIAAFGVMFSDNLTQTLETLMGKTGSIITNGTTNKGDKDDKEDKEDDKNKLDKEINDNNKAWLENVFLSAMNNHTDRINGYIGGYSENKTGPNFKNTNGLIDSDSNSTFLGDIGLLNGGGLKDSSWAFAGYKNENKELCYGVSIYNKDKNGGLSLADQKVNTPITTDIYTVNTVTGKVELYKENVTTQKVGTNKNGTHVIRDPGYI
mgnify:CR=1 FL=1